MVGNDPASGRAGSFRVEAGVNRSDIGVGPAGIDPANTYRQSRDGGAKERPRPLSLWAGSFRVRDGRAPGEPLPLKDGELIQKARQLRAVLDRPPNPSRAAARAGAPFRSGGAPLRHVGGRGLYGQDRLKLGNGTAERSKASTRLAPLD